MRGQANATASGEAEVTTASPILPIQQYYRLSQVADRLSVSEKTVARLVDGDPDLLVVTDRRRGVRAYKTVLIPESSLRRLVEGLRQN